MRRHAWWLVVTVALLLAFAYTLVHRVGEQRAKVAAARKGVLVLSDCVQTYKLNHGDYPPSLEALTQQPEEGKGSLIDDKALTDPWGHRYEYDPDGTRGDGLTPDVWSNGPDPTRDDSIIGNWQRRQWTSPGGE